MIVVDLACRLNVIRRNAYARLTPTADQSTPCPTTFIGSLNVERGHTCTGISSGYKNNVSSRHARMGRVGAVCLLGC